MFSACWVCQARVMGFGCLVHITHLYGYCFARLASLLWSRGLSCRPPQSECHWIHLGLNQGLWCLHQGMMKNSVSLSAKFPLCLPLRWQTAKLNTWNGYLLVLDIRLMWRPYVFDVLWKIGVFLPKTGMKPQVFRILLWLLVGKTVLVSHPAYLTQTIGITRYQRPSD